MTPWPYCCIFSLQRQLGPLPAKAERLFIRPWPCYRRSLFIAPETLLMSYVVCHLCRAKTEVEENSSACLRCRRCGAKLDSGLIQQDVQTASEHLACHSCLRVFAASLLGALSTCPNCGVKLDIPEAQKLAVSLQGAEQLCREKLLQGQSALAIAEILQQRGADRDASWKFADRLVSELPFERHQAWLDRRDFTPSQACDSCGLGDSKLTAYLAVWDLPANELKRYHQGYAGYEGEFAKSKAYRREAIYTLCPNCAKRRNSEQFADGYPHNIGYTLSSFKPWKA